MSVSASVSGRIASIYESFYEEREVARFEAIYGIFAQLAHFAEASEENVCLQLDYLRLVEAIRSYFLDTIRYKEYHFDPKDSDPDVRSFLGAKGISSVNDLDPLSKDWTELVHTTAKINGSKVAAYTVKWLLKSRPINLVRRLSIEEELAQIEDTGPPKQQSSFIANINEHLAIQCALFALEIDMRDVAPARMDELLYNLRFRPFEESAYFMILSRDFLCPAAK